MRIVLTGGSGFIGRRLASGQGEWRLLGRKEWDAQGPAPPPVGIFEGADAVVHLAGTPVAQRWTADAKRRIRESRVNGTRLLVEAIAAAGRRPQTLVCASAIGIYGERGDEVLTESSPPGEGFLSGVCKDWEREADAGGELGLRVVKLRFGVVLGRDGGALARMLPAFKLGAGGRLGSGGQWMSWIHVDDAVALIRFALAEPALAGAVNAVAPNPVTNAAFTSALGRVLVRPAFVFVPGFALKALLGEMSQVLLGSQRVLPEAARQAGFAFQYPLLEPALRQILNP